MSGHDPVGATAAVMQKYTEVAESVPEMRVIHLNLADLDELIRRYEDKYRVSTISMLSNPEERAKISEDDLLEWEAYVSQRSALREHYEEIHRQYLRQRGVPGRKKTTEEDPSEYAA